ncbi:MAG: DUF5666 domain-containing protein [Chloroflexi bacterium]|nr:DUF5666 domain-containing protein [Chloroflexota bacterium]
MRISFTVMLIGVIIVGLAAGVGAGYFQATSSNSVAAAASAANGARAASFQSGSSQQTMGRPVMGAVDKVGTQDFTLKEEAGSTAVTIRVNDQTSIRKQAEGSVADIKKGDRIVVRGDSGQDGALNASNIQIMPADAGNAMSQAGSEQQRQGGPAGGAGQRRQGGSPKGGANSGGAQAGNFMMATVDSVDGNTITVTPLAGMMGQASSQTSPQKVVISDKTSIAKTVDGTFQDIKAGEGVVVRGPRGADGVVVATNIDITPPGASMRERRQ